MWFHRPQTEICLFWSALVISKRPDARHDTFSGHGFYPSIDPVVAAYDCRPESYKLGIFTWRTKKSPGQIVTFYDKNRQKPPFITKKNNLL